MARRFQKAVMPIACALFSVSLALAAEPMSIGARVDSVTLQDTKGAAATFPLKARTTVLVFYSIECPISNDYNERMNEIYKDYTARGAQVIFANANQNESVDGMIAHSKAAGFLFPVFKDHLNALADRLGATVTPEAYVFDTSGALRYHGQIDDARNPARAQVHGLRNALDQVLAGQPVTKPESKTFGCTIKRVRKAS